MRKGRHVRKRRGNGELPGRQSPHGWGTGRSSKNLSKFSRHGWIPPSGGGFGIARLFHLVGRSAGYPSAAPQGTWRAVLPLRRHDHGTNLGGQARRAAPANTRPRETAAAGFLPLVWHILCTRDWKLARMSPNRFEWQRRADVMNAERTVLNTERRGCVTDEARSTCAVLSGNIPGDTITPTNTARFRRLETPEDIARALRVASTRSDGTSRRVVAVLVALVVMCLVMAAIVWWRLLT